MVHIVTTLWWFAGFFLAVYTKITEDVVKVCLSPAAAYLNLMYATANR